MWCTRSRTRKVTKQWHSYRGAEISNRMLAMQRTNFSIGGRTLKSFEQMSGMAPHHQQFPWKPFFPSSCNTAWMLEHNQEFMASQFRYCQICYLHTFIESQLEIPVLLTALVQGFGCDWDRVTQALLHGLEPPDARRCHLELVDNAEREILVAIETQTRKSTALRRRDIQKHIRTRYNALRLRTTEKTRCTLRYWFRFKIGCETLHQCVNFRGVHPHSISSQSQ
jgi:hypothetical protein